MKILTVVGARPQFIKAAVVSRAILTENEKSGERINEVIVHTGQHYNDNMSAIFFREMKIPEPTYNLGVSDCSHGAMTGRMLEEIEKVILKEKPHIVLVYGDTNSTLAGALTAAKLHIPVAHVEAGLRSFNMRMPEEINRILTDRISEILFCPTEVAVRNLAKEGITGETRRLPRPPVVLSIGDVMYDATLFYRKIAEPSERVAALLSEVGDNFYLATVHRAENTDNADRLHNIIDAFHELSARTPVVLPLHPRTKKMIEQYGFSLNGVKVLEPVGYFDMLKLLERCKAVFTDSGGVQKEAYFFGKRSLVLRDETEWVELVEIGVNRLIGARKKDILEAAQIMNCEFDSPSGVFGTGDAGHKIVRFLCESRG